MTNGLIVHVLGLTTDELCFQKDIENAIVRTEKNNRKTQTHLDEITVVIKRQQNGETPVKYLITVRAAGEVEQFIAKAWGESLRSTINELCKNFGKALRKEKHPKSTSKMWGHFLR